MALYSATALTGATANAAPHAQFHTGASRAVIRAIEIFNSAATANTIVVGRHNALGTATTSQLGQAYDASSPAALENLETAWSSAPTLPAQFLFGVFLSASIGTGMIWAFPQGEELVIPASSGLVFWNNGGSSGGVLRITVKYVV